MKRLSLFLLLAASLFIYNACDNGFSMGGGNSAALEDEGVQYIPAEANTVSTMNMQKILDKMDYESVKDMEFFQEMKEGLKEDRPEMVYLLEDPTESGVDLSQNIYMFSDETEDNETFMATVMPLKSSQQFKQMLQVAGDNGEVSIDDKGSYSVATTNSDAVVVWDAKTAIVGNSSSNKETLTNKLVELLTNKPKQNIAANDKFKDAFNTDHDFFSFSDFEMANMFIDDEAEAVLEGLDLTKEDVQDNHMVYYGDFNDGKAEMTQELVLNPKIEELMGAVMKKQVKTDFSDFIPSEDLIGVSSMALNLEGINTLVNEQIGGAQMVDISLKTMAGLTRDELMKTFDGDAFIAGYATASTSGDTPDLLFGLKLNDKEAFGKILSDLEEKGVLKAKSSNLYTLAIGKMFDIDYDIAIKSDVVLFGKGVVVEDAANGSSPRISKSDLDAVDDSSFGLYADFDKMGDYYPGISFDVFEDLKANGGLNGGKSTLRFKDKNQNSLKSLMEFINEMYKQNEKDGNDLKFDI